MRSDGLSHTGDLPWSLLEMQITGSHPVPSSNLSLQVEWRNPSDLDAQKVHKALILLILQETLWFI
jgi:hypothetical protein